jgi:hypothetical protein
VLRKVGGRIGCGGLWQGAQVLSDKVNPDGAAQVKMGLLNDGEQR